MQKALSTVIKSQYIAAIYTTGVTTSASSAVDIQGFQGCLFTQITSTTTTTRTLLVQGSATTASTDFQNLASATLSSTVASRLLQVDIHRPTHRYLRVVNNSTGIADVGGVLAQLYGPASVPVTQASTDVASSTVLYSATT